MAIEITTNSKCWAEFDCMTRLKKSFFRESHDLIRFSRRLSNNHYAWCAPAYKRDGRLRVSLGFATVGTVNKLYCLVSSPSHGNTRKRATFAQFFRRFSNVPEIHDDNTIFARRCSNVAFWQNYIKESKTGQLPHAHNDNNMRLRTNRAKRLKYGRPAPNRTAHIHIPTWRFSSQESTFASSCKLDTLVTDERRRRAWRTDAADARWTWAWFDNPWPGS